MTSEHEEAIMTTSTDKYGRGWDLPVTELCPECGQPDSVGDCNHAPLTVSQVESLGGTIHEETIMTTSTETTTIDPATITDEAVIAALSEFGDYAPALSALEDGGYLEAIRAVLALEAEDEEHGIDEGEYQDRLGEIYGSVDWRQCYHERGYRTAYHFDVKLRGGYRPFQDRLDEINEDRGGLLNTDEIERIARDVQDWELQSWWEMVLPEVADHFNVGEVRDPETKRTVNATTWFSCGRSGGYVTMPWRYLNRGVSMVLMAWELAGFRDYYNGAEWAVYLVDQSVERYDEIALSDLASPRIDPWY